MTTLDHESTADNDELDILACCMSGWDPADVDLTGDDFRDAKLEATWQAMCKVSAAGEIVNPVSVRLALGPSGDRAAAWLHDVFSRPVVPSNAPALAARVKRGADLRRLMTLGRRILQEASQDGADPEQVIDLLRKAADEPMGTARTTTTIAEAVPRVIDQIERGTAAGLSTPWPDLDKLIHGFHAGQLVVVAARPGVGKSLLGQNLALHWGRKHQLPTYFASLEMEVDELTRRTLAQATQVDLSNLLSGDLTEGMWSTIGSRLPVRGSEMVHVCEDPTQTIDSIRNGARQIQRRYGLGLVVVDYLQLVTPRTRRGGSREQEVAETSRGLKLLAKELKVPVVAMSQVRRLGDAERAKRPTMSDLRESGAIEQDADTILILHVPDDENEPWNGEIHVAKARAGRRDTVPVQMLTKWATVAPSARLRPPAEQPAFTAPDQIRAIRASKEQAS